MEYILLFVLAGAGLASLAGLLASRAICLILGAIALLCGVVAPAAIWGYANVFVAGDPSAYGMLGTILVILFVPFGVTISLIGVMKSE